MTMVTMGRFEVQKFRWHEGESTFVSLLVEGSPESTLSLTW